MDETNSVFDIQAKDMSKPKEEVTKNNNED